jgi:hypothetical protein
MCLSQKLKEMMMNLMKVPNCGLNERDSNSAETYPVNVKGTLVKYLAVAYILYNMQGYFCPEDKGSGLFLKLIEFNLFMFHKSIYRLTP